MARANDNRVGFLLFLDHWQQFTELTPEECKNVLQALFAACGADCDMPELTRLERVIFNSINADVQRSLENYDERRKQRAEAGRKGGLISRPPESDRQSEANGSNAKQTEANGSKRKQMEANGSNAKQTEANEAKNKNKNKSKSMSKNNDNTVCIVHAAAEKAEQTADSPVYAADAAPPASSSSSAASKKSGSAAQADAHFEALWQRWPNKRGKSAVKPAQRKRLLAVSVEEMSRAISRYEKELAASPADRQMLNGSTWFNGRYEDYLDANYTPPPTRRPAPKSPRAGQTQFRSAEEESRLAEWIHQREE